MRYDEDKVKATWNFVNKIWNASRYVLMNTSVLKEINLDNITSSDKWILTKLNKTIKSVTKNMEKYDFNLVGNELYKFIWEDFCDTYIEYSKTSQDNISTKSTLILVLADILKMLHPFMPYVTDEIYEALPVKEADNIILSSYPKYDKKQIFDKEEKEIDALIEIISTIRNARKENNIPKEYSLINNFNEDFKYIIENNKDILTKLVKCDIISTANEDLAKLDLSFSYGVLTLSYKGKETTEEDIENLKKEIASLENSIERRNKLLSNEKYVANAPSHIVEEERNKLADEISKLEILKSKLN